MTQPTPNKIVNKAIAAQNMTAQEWGLLVFLSLLWGGSFFLNGVVVKQLPPLTAVWLRVGLAIPILLAILLLLGLRLPRERRVWAAIFAMGLLNTAAPFALIAWGLTHIESGLAAILNATTPLFTVVVANWTTPDEKMNGNRLAGVCLGLIGVAVMVGPEVFAGARVNAGAELACLGAALSYACAGVFGRRFKRLGVAPLQIALGQIIASAILLTPLVLWVDQPWRLPFPSLPVWGALVGLAVLGTALGYVVYFRILSTGGATNVALVTFLVPVSAILLGWLFLNEKLSVAAGAGMILISLGLAAIDGRWLKWARAHF